MRPSRTPVACKSSTTALADSRIPLCPVALVSRAATRALISYALERHHVLKHARYEFVRSVLCKVTVCLIWQASWTAQHITQLSLS